MEIEFSNKNFPHYGNYLSNTGFYYHKNVHKKATANKNMKQVRVSRLKKGLPAKKREKNSLTWTVCFSGIKSHPLLYYKAFAQSDIHNK